jgi:hypothetical protein
MQIITLGLCNNAIHSASYGLQTYRTAHCGSVVSYSLAGDLHLALPILVWFAISAQHGKALALSIKPGCEVSDAPSSLSPEHQLSVG